MEIICSFWDSNLKPERHLHPSQVYPNGLGTLLSLAQFPGKIRLINWLGSVVGRFAAEADCRPVKGARVSVSLSDRIGRLMWAGSYEPELVRLLKGFLDPGMTLVDVGAQVGYFSVVAAALVGQTGAVHSFEPDPDCFSKLRENAQAYAWIKTYNSAVADFSGRITFYPSPEQGESGWGAIFDDSGKRAEITVGACSLDIWASASRPERVDFIKIDVEGAECRVLDGAKALIAETRPLLWVEVNEVCLSRDGKSPSHLLKRLLELNYVTQGFGERSLRSVENIVAIPAERSDIFERLARAGVNLFHLHPPSDVGELM
jgi:FkbM family methyltransferase